MIYYSLISWTHPLKIARGVAELFQGRSFGAVHVSLGAGSSKPASAENGSLTSQKNMYEKDSLKKGRLFVVEGTSFRSLDAFWPLSEKNIANTNWPCWPCYEVCDHAGHLILRVIAYRAPLSLPAAGHHAGGLSSSRGGDMQPRTPRVSWNLPWMKAFEEGFRRAHSAGGMWHMKRMWLKWIAKMMIAFLGKQTLPRDCVHRIHILRSQFEGSNDQKQLASELRQWHILTQWAVFQMIVRP